MLVISEFQPENIMIIDFLAKNHRIADWRVLSVSEFDGKKLFHFKCFKTGFIFTDY